MSLIYLASPYSDSSETKRYVRMKMAAEASAKVWMSTGKPVYCPVAHGFQLEKFMPKAQAEDHAVWMAHCYQLLDRCDSLLVYCIPGWKESRGVQMEIARARLTCKPIKYLWDTEPFAGIDIRETPPS